MSCHSCHTYCELQNASTAHLDITQSCPTRVTRCGGNDLGIRLTPCIVCCSKTHAGPLCLLSTSMVVPRAHACQWSPCDQYTVNWILKCLVTDFAILPVDRFIWVLSCTLTAVLYHSIHNMVKEFAKLQKWNNHKNFQNRLASVSDKFLWHSEGVLFG